MAKHFLSVLGTTLYEPVIYQDGEFLTQDEQEFIQIAFVEKYLKELEEDGGKVTIFVTTKSRRMNLEDREYTDKEVGFAEKWKSDKKNQVIAGHNKKGLVKQFHEMFPSLEGKLDIVDIADAQKEDEIWSVFNTIYDKLREEDEIIFDITHSFRSIPMLAMAVINYAKTLKNCKLTGIYYGAYEASSEEIIVGKKVAPISNLTVYNEILDWTNAANAFTRFGNASLIKEVFDDKLSTIPYHERKNWKPLKNIVTSTTTLSDGILTSRGVDCEIKEVVNSSSEISIKKAYRQFAQNLDETGTAKAKELKPLYPLFEKVRDDFAIFDNESNYEVGLAVVGWAIDNDMIQQGFTALEETIKTYLCHIYELNEVQKKYREDVVSLAITALGNAISAKKKLDTPEERMLILKENAIILQKISQHSEDEVPLTEDIYRPLFVDDNVEIVKLAMDIKEDRNDINHFGMRTNPKKPKDLQKHLRDNYTKFCEIIKKREDNHNNDIS